MGIPCPPRPCLWDRDGNCIDSHEGVDQRCTTPGWISLWSVNTVAHMGPKTANLANFQTSRGACIHPIHRSWPNLACKTRPTVYTYVLNLIVRVIVSPSRGKNTNFCLCSTSSFCFGPAQRYRDTVQKLCHSKAWRTTNGKHRTFSPPGSTQTPTPTKLGTVIEIVRTILAPQKRIRIRPYSFAARGAENLGGNEPPKF